MESISFGDKLSLANILIAVLLAILTWIVSWIIFKAQASKKQLSYHMRMTPVITHDFSGGRGVLEVKYNGEIIDKLVLFEIDIKNTGNSAVENAGIRLSNQGGVYLIPGYFEDVPPGYDDLWEIEREDGEDSLIRLQHINPGQVAKVRFVMDNLPRTFPTISCPMAGLELKKVRLEEFKPIIRVLSEMVIRKVLWV